MATSLCACGKSEAVKIVESEISSLGVITVDSKKDIEKIESDLNALSDKEKSKVDNKDVFLNAKTELSKAEEIANVEQKIDALVNDLSEYNITNARSAYDSLDQDSKAKVTNYSELESSELSWNAKKEFASLADGCTWYFNGGDDAIINSIKFNPNYAIINQKVFDGNGGHENGEKDYKYSIDGSTISIVLRDGSTMEIPYSTSNDQISLTDKDYYTLEEVDKGLQGFWTVDKRTKVLNKNIHSKGTVHINNGYMETEDATEAIGDPRYEYFYSGPGVTPGHEGKYSLGFGCFESDDINNASFWGFNIIDGNVVLLEYDTVYSKANISKMPGQYGYSF